VREYKFRAYDTYTKTMLPIVDIIKFTKSEDIYITRNGTYGVGVNIQYQPRIKLMQYTGLHDKNGVEIYEGDIVKALINEIWYIGQVIYEYSGFTIDVTNNKQLEFGRRGIIERFTEVVGNIYDNLDLLKGE